MITVSLVVLMYIYKLAKLMHELERNVYLLQLLITLKN